MKTVFQIDKWNVNRLTGFFSSELSMRLVRGEMRINEPMSRHTSWRAGGIARRYFIPADLEDLGLFLQQLPVDEPVYMVGLGSNLLVRDGGLPGTVIAVHARLNDLQLMRQDSECGLIYAGAGVACAKVTRFAAMHQLAGAEFLAGIPGTVGGALAMNAGCYGAETWEIIEQVQVITRSGKISVQSPDDYEIGYRSVRRKAVSDSDSEWFVGGYFQLKTGDEAVSRQKIRQLLTRRVQSQPLNKPSAGSVFRNPPRDHAARLIEACGLKGMRVGGAMVSTQHANFIVNIANASATDIETLIMLVQEKVKKETGVELMPEVHIIGKTGSNA